MIRVKGLGAFLVSVGLLGLVIGLFGFSASLNPIDVILGRGRQITVPDLTGMSLPRAKVEADRVGLRQRTREAYSLTVPRGSIIRQEPTAGSRARVGQELELTVSRGENSARMPDAVGEPFKDVRGPLDDASIKVIEENVYSETIEEGIVIAQSPGPGIILRGSDIARFTVSRGPEERPIPDVKGMTANGAGFLLGQAGFVVDTIGFADDDQVLPGRVSQTDPVIGTNTAKGTRVVIKLSAGSEASPVPDVRGMTTDAAQRILADAGFTAQISAKVLVGGDDSIGKVVEQNPAAGEEWRSNHAMTIVVGIAPPTPPPTTTTTTTTAPPPESGDGGTGGVTTTTRAGGN